MLTINVVTLFPEVFDASLRVSILGRAATQGLVRYRVVQLREYTHDRHKTVDDYPYGGGAGMVLKPEPFFEAVEDLRAGPPIVLLSARGRPFSHGDAVRFAVGQQLTLLCGHYKDVDQRVVDGLAAEELSVGDFVLSGGEPAALCVLDAVVRLLPGALGDHESAATDSHYDGLLSPPSYTRPPSYRGMDVPAVLLSGDHEKIAARRGGEGARLKRGRRARPRGREQGCGAGGGAGPGGGGGGAGGGGGGARDGAGGPGGDRGGPGAFFAPLFCPPIRGLRDSKLLAPVQRARLARVVRARAFAVTVGAASVREIDRINIRRASILAMRRALAPLGCSPALVPVDGLPVPEPRGPHQAIIDGDARCHSIAAASVIAKTVRDHLMELLAVRHPLYAWASNKGYGTPEHLSALADYGFTPHHRKSFAPVIQLLLSSDFLARV